MIKRNTVAALALSAAGLATIISHEGYSERAIIPVPGDVPTIGFGTTGGVKLGDKTDPVKAIQRAVIDSKKFTGELKKCMQGIELYQHEFDAYTSLAYNVGSGAVCRSSIIKKLKAGNYKEACATILQFDKYQGKPLRGLTIRRQEEYKICIGEKQ